MLMLSLTSLFRPCACGGWLQVLYMSMYRKLRPGQKSANIRKQMLYCYQCNNVTSSGGAEVTSLRGGACTHDHTPVNSCGCRQLPQAFAPIGAV